MKPAIAMLGLAALAVVWCGAGRAFAANWGGYIVLSPRSSVITQVSGTFRVPQVRLGDDTGQSNVMSAWVGIGGVTGQQMLAQVGIVCVVATDSSADCYGLYAFGHGYSAVLNRTTYPVAAGDIISAGASCTANCIANGTDESWTLTLTDATQDGLVKWVWTDSSFTARTSDLQSAEWIIELPAKPPCCNTLYPLVSFGSMPFMSAVYNNAAADLTKAIRVNLRSPTGRAFPSAPNETKDGFLVCGAPASQPPPTCTGTPTLHDLKEGGPDKF